jgi:xanthine dehydrogenase/oxidase
VAADVSFFLNGRRVTVENPSPDLLLIDYLRSPDVALSGPKKPCGQGGCGGCTVILSSWNVASQQAEHRAINSCLRPVCALGGLVVTTIEGTGAVRRPNPAFAHHASTFGRFAPPADAALTPQLLEARDAVHSKRQRVLKSVQAALKVTAAKRRIREATAEHPSAVEHEGMNPVAHRLALNNGSQCGYCSVGFVMNMSEFIFNHPNATKREIEDIFDGNLCRCTGYRSILTGMKTFASDWTVEDERKRMKCKSDDGGESQLPAAVVIPFPPDAQINPEPVWVEGDPAWLTPTTLDDLARIMDEARRKKIRLVHGNTSFGVYKEEYEAAEVLVDIRLIPELDAAPKSEKSSLYVAAGMSYSDFIDLLTKELGDHAEDVSTRLGALRFMAQRTAGRIVRNAASLGGNTMLVLHHIATGEPFPSDLVTALVAAEAAITYLEVNPGGSYQIHTSSLEDLIERTRWDAALAGNIVLIGYELPRGAANEALLPQKVALREVNSHSIVNATSRLEWCADKIVRKGMLVLGGIAPFPWRARKTESALEGTKLTLEEIPKVAELLEAEVRGELDRWAGRMKDLPSEGFTNEYRIQLSVAFLVKAIVNALLEQGEPVPERIRSSGIVTWGRWPVSDGIQFYKSQAYKAPVAEPYIKLTAMYQTSGQVHYTHELPVPPLALNAAFVQSTRALANYYFQIPGEKGPVDVAKLRNHLSTYSPSFVDLITHDQIKDGGINQQGMGGDQPILAEDRVSYVGQSIALVLAATEREAIRIAEYVTQRCVGYDPIDWKAPWNEPVLGLEQAIRMNSVFPDWPASAPFMSHIWKITRPASRFDWATPGKDPLDCSIVARTGTVDGRHCHIVESTQTTGGQIHFYMEPQACIAEPADSRRMIVRPSSQSPMEMHQTVAMALGVEYHRVEVQVPPVGGGFGGKTEQARFVAGAAAVAAHATKRPVRLAVPREEDTSMIGKRHAYHGQYQIAIDSGQNNPAERGIIRGLQTKMWGDGGAFYDCSFIVSNCIQLRADNAYRVLNFENQIDVCRTNTAPSTAFRSFGDAQAKVILENALDDAAFLAGMLPEDVREINLYDRGDVTPFGQALSYCYIKTVWSYLKEKCRYEEKRQSVTEFNRANKWRKRGLAIIPVKYGSGYNLAQLEQAAAFIAINQGDGSVIVHQGGVEMGQGLLTQVEQITSYVLNVPMELIYIESPKTNVTPNPTSTGGSTGTAYNGEAVKQTCEELRKRLTDFGYQMLKENGPDWCKQQGIDFWNYGEKGWAAELPGSDNARLVWQNLIQLAYANRVSLVASYTAKIRGGTTPVPAMTFKTPAEQPEIPGIEPASTQIAGAVDSFSGFTYSAACSVVEVDILTGETKILSSDIVYDMGWSLNPAIDVGQVEGAFVQGIGYLLTEKLVFEEDGPEKGRLNTANTWRYKPPAVSTIPLEMNVYLFPRDKADVPENPDGIFSSKEVGEPPLVLATTVFFAVKAAVRDSRLERNLSGLFRFDAPATVQEVRRACEVSIADLGQAQ